MWEDVVGGGPVPGVVVLPCGGVGSGPGVVRDVVSGVLGVVQEWLEGERFAGSRLVIVTRGAVSVGGGDVPDLAGAAVWGLVRSAQAGVPDRFVLADLGEGVGLEDGLAVAVSVGEPQVVVREDGVRVARLGRVGVDVAGVSAGSVLAPASGEVVASSVGGFGSGAVLVTGASGSLGGLVARRLVSVFGVRELVLVSRRGGGAAGAGALAAELEAAGARVVFEACDVSDRDGLAKVLADHPVSGVVHLAGVLDDGVIGAMTPERLGGVFAPKVDAAWHLHELTAGMDLSAFVLFSSAAGVLGNAGQANYAAANTFLDGLAAHRRARGLPGKALAWGLWSAGDGMGGGLSGADLRRMKQVGIEGLSAERGLELFDTAMGLDDPALVPIQLNLATLRQTADNLPELLHALAPPPRRRTAVGKADPGALRRALDALDADGQHDRLQELVIGLAAGLLGYQDAGGIAPERDFLELGFDSLMAMELRSALSEAIGLRLPSMVVFDHKSAAALARFLLAEISAAGPVAGAPSVDATPQAGTGAGRPSGAAADTLSQLFREALQNSPVEKAMTMLNAVAETRPAFTSASDIPALPVPVRLMEGPAGRTRLICLSTPMATSGVYQHAHIANHFKGIRGVAGIPLPGFVRGDSLPATNDAAAEVLAEAALEAAGGERFVLAGYSAGGILAHAAAMHLEQRGVRPAGLVLMDSYLPDVSSGLLDGLLVTMLEMEKTFDGFDSARLSSMGRYSSMLASFSLEGLQAPVLFLQCARPFPGADTDGPGNPWQAAPWNGNQTVRGVGANHFTMLEEGAADCARAIEDWIGTLD